MGVPHLWKSISATAQHRNLARIAWEHFVENGNGIRALRLGVDAYPWIIHAEKAEYGACPVIQTIFWRLCRLLSLGIKAVFVLDGPRVKNGRHLGGQETRAERLLCELLELFGFEWVRAHSNAEAELAALNAAGRIDAAMTDDIDVFLFGANFVIRNWGTKLSGHGGGAKAKEAEAARRAMETSPAGSDEKDEDEQVSNEQATSDWIYCFSMDRIKAKIRLDRDGLVFMAVLCGGDLEKGTVGIGETTARALAFCGFGASLCRAVREGKDHARVTLSAWLGEVRHELRTNAHGFMKRRERTKAAELGEGSVTAEMVETFIRPLTSAIRPIAQRSGDFTWSNRPDVAGIAAFAYRVFEWPRDHVGQRMRTSLWPGLAMDELRLSALSGSAPSNDLRMLGNFQNRQREIANRGHQIEYRIELDPSAWAGRVIEQWPDGPDPNVTKHEARRIEDHDRYETAKGSPSKQRCDLGIQDPFSSMRVWVPKVYMDLGAPGSIERWRQKAEELKATRVQERKARAKAARATPTKARASPKKGLEKLVMTAEQSARKANRGKKVDGSELAACLRNPTRGRSSSPSPAPRSPLKRANASSASSPDYVVLDSSDDDNVDLETPVVRRQSPKKKLKTTTPLTSTGPASSSDDGDDGPLEGDEPLSLTQITGGVLFPYPPAPAETPASSSTKGKSKPAQATMDAFMVKSKPGAPVAPSKRAQNRKKEIIELDKSPVARAQPTYIEID